MISNSIALIFFYQHEFNAFTRPHGQFCICGGTPQWLPCGLRNRASSASVSKQPASNPCNSWESTCFGANPESLEKWQSPRGK